MNFSTTLFIALAGATILTGCNDTIAEIAGQNPPGGAAPVATSVGQTMPTFADTGSSTSQLSGVAAYYGKPTVAFMKTSGTLVHKTGATTLKDDNVTLNDADGVNQTGNVKILSDSTSRVVIDDANFAGAYDYVRPYTTSYTVGTTKEVIKGVYGIATTAALMPTGGSATYSGDANADVALSTGAKYTMIGKSAVTANFGSGTVDVKADQFKAFAVGGGSTATTTAPIDTVTVTGMKIAGNQFSGGTNASSKNGAAVNILGAGAVNQAAGRFYGYDDGKSVPDEVGGIVNMSGASGQVHMIFLAD